MTDDDDMPLRRELLSRVEDLLNRVEDGGKLPDAETHRGLDLILDISDECGFATASRILILSRPQIKEALAARGVCIIRAPCGAWFDMETASQVAKIAMGVGVWGCVMAIAHRETETCPIIAMSVGAPDEMYVASATVMTETISALRHDYQEVKEKGLQYLQDRANATIEDGFSSEVALEMMKDSADYLESMMESMHSAISDVMSKMGSTESIPTPQDIGKTHSEGYCYYSKIFVCDVSPEDVESVRSSTTPLN